jgi:hypothetical protein
MPDVKLEEIWIIDGDSEFRLPSAFYQRIFVQVSYNTAFEFLCSPPLFAWWHPLFVGRILCQGTLRLIKLELRALEVSDRNP